MTSELDLKKIARMAQLVSLAKSREITIPNFVSEQWDLIDGLVAIDPRWKQEVFALVNFIEDTYVAAIDRGNTKLPTEDTQLIDETLAGISSLIANCRWASVN